MANLDILEELFDKKKLTLLRTFYNDPQKKFYLRELASITGVSVTSTFRFIQTLLKLEIIKTYEIGKFKVYSLGDNENTRYLGQIVRKERQIVELFITRVKEMQGLSALVLQGELERDRANLVLIGEKIDAQPIKELCAEIKEKFNYKILPLIVSQDQYEQMVVMYPTKRLMLFRK